MSLENEIVSRSEKVAETFTRLSSAIREYVDRNRDKVYSCCYAGVPGNRNRKSAPEGGFSILEIDTKYTLYCGSLRVEETKLLQVRIVFVCFIVTDYSVAKNFVEWIILYAS